MNKKKFTYRSALCGSGYNIHYWADGENQSVIYAYNVISEDVAKIIVESLYSNLKHKK